MIHNVLDLNQFFTPAALSRGKVEQSIDPMLVGPEGVADLDFALDNRHIPDDLQFALCNELVGEETREYLATLINLAWPKGAALNLCCQTECSSKKPDFVFRTREDEGPIALAPHFLTAAFGSEQQEILTAALIAKINTLGKPMLMELVGSLDLGVTGTRFCPRKYFDEFPYQLGQAWGNKFLDCNPQGGKDAGHVLCQASTEQDRKIGRAEDYWAYAMFTCAGNQYQEDYS